VKRDPRFGDTQIALLQRMPVFGGIREDILKLLLELSPLVSVPQSQFFFHQGDRADSMFVLERGKVAILKSWQGREYLLQHRQTGDSFGEMALIDLCPRSASVLAVEDCTASEVSSTTLYRIDEKDLEQLTLIYMNMGRAVSRRLCEADERLFQAKVEALHIGEDYVFKSV